VAFVKQKIVNNKNRYYLEKSVRLPNSKIKKYSLYLKEYKEEDLKNYETILNNKIAEDFAKNYKHSSVFNFETLKKLESIKFEYKYITKKLTNKQFNDIMDRFAINFTYESNAIEGNSLTLKDVVIVINEKKSIKGKELREIHETINAREAIELVFNKKIKINESDIIKIHSILTKNTGVNKGYKKIPNFILGRNIETTPPENVKKEMDKLISWYNDNKEMHILQRASIFHGFFEKIHPFEDGNGRVGRMLINIMLINNGYSPLIIRKTHRLSYLNALETFDNKYYSKLESFIIEKYKETFEKFFKVYIKYL